MSYLADEKKLLNFYISHLKNDVLPFWLNKMDGENGGVFSCINNMGDEILSTDKYTWSQGRIVWIYSKLATMDIFSDEEKEVLLGYAKSTAYFLMKNVVLENGNCSFILTKEGIPKPEIHGGRCDTNITADQFVILGLSKYGAVSGDMAALNFAKDLYKRVLERTESSGKREFRSAPMMMLNVTSELALAMKELSDSSFEETDKWADAYMYDVINNFVGEDYLIHERNRVNGPNDKSVMIERYINPGHTIEDMWFVMHQAATKGNIEVIRKAVKVLKAAFEKGWDKEWGGILLFADEEGGKPRGSIKGMEKDSQVQKLLNDWSNKVWWSHSETLYTTLLSYILTGDEEAAQLFNTVHDYVFKTFPNPNKEIGEWIQIRDRMGNPEDKFVALPVKDPFHIMRNMALIIELLQGKFTMADKV